MRLLCSVSKKRKMKMAFKYHLLGALLMGTVASVGTLVGGPSGGVMGGLLCGWMMHKKLKSVPQIIMELPADKQKRLFNEATAIIRSQIGTNIKQLTRTDIEQLVMNSETLQEKLVDMLKNYFKKELDLEVK